MGLPEPRRGGGLLATGVSQWVKSGLSSSASPRMGATDSAGTIQSAFRREEWDQLRVAFSVVNPSPPFGGSDDSS
jgi:hypothetical protein